MDQQQKFEEAFGQYLTRSSKTNTISVTSIHDAPKPVIVIAGNSMQAFDWAKKSGLGQCHWKYADDLTHVKGMREGCFVVVGSAHENRLMGDQTVEFFSYMERHGIPLVKLYDVRKDFHGKA